MQPEVVFNAITTVGFPIVMCLIMLWYMVKERDDHTAEMNATREAHKEETNMLRTAIENNTLALTRIIEKLGDTHE